MTSGTVMADTKLPLTCWFRAMHPITITKQGISAIELGRRLGVSYPTAWYLHKRLRQAMTERGGHHALGAAPAASARRSRPMTSISAASATKAAEPRAKPASSSPASVTRTGAWDRS